MILAVKVLVFVLATLAHNYLAGEPPFEKTVTHSISTAADQAPKDAPGP